MPTTYSSVKALLFSPLQRLPCSPPLVSPLCAQPTLRSLGTCLALPEDRDPMPALRSFLVHACRAPPLWGWPWAPVHLLLACLASSVPGVWAVKGAIFRLCYPQNYLVSVLPWCLILFCWKMSVCLSTLRGNGDEGNPCPGGGGHQSRIRQPPLITPPPGRSGLSTAGDIGQEGLTGSSGASQPEGPRLGGWLEFQTRGPICFPTALEAGPGLEEIYVIHSCH